MNIRYPEYLVWVDGHLSPAACLSEFEEDAIKEGIVHCTFCNQGGTLTNAKGDVLGVFVEQCNYEQFIGYIPRSLAS
jgi:hypothetical protein